MRLSGYRTATDRRGDGHMRVLMVGLGDIARKAYLPVLAALPDLELHLATRDADVLDAVAARYRIENAHVGLDAALASGAFDAAFVHAATPAHPGLVTTLLERDIPVFVDKPLADSADEAARLVTLAQNRDVLLGVGFNRRFAPDYAALRQTPRSLILMQKHRHAQADTPRRVVFDDFIHVVDTLRFLAPARPMRETIETVMRDGRLEAVTLTLAGDGYHAIGTMHRASGLDEERIDILGGNGKRAVVNLAERIEQDGTEHVRRRGDWTPVAEQRGFSAMCADFLAAVRARRPTAGDDIMATHRLCEAIVQHAEGR